MDFIEKQKKYYEKSYHNIKDFLDKCIIKDDYNELNKELTSNNKVIDFIDKLLNDYSIPTELYLIYHHLQSEKSKIQINNSFFFSLDEINKMSNNYKNSNQTRFFDIMLRYGGLGNYIVMSWDKILKKIFFRLDGGSNNFDRQSRKEFFIGTENIKPKFNPENEKYCNKLFNFKYALHLLLDDKITNDILIYCD